MCCILLISFIQYFQISSSYEQDQSKISILNDTELSDYLESLIGKDETTVNESYFSAIVTYGLDKALWPDSESELGRQEKRTIVAACMQSQDVIAIATIAEKKYSAEIAKQAENHQFHQFLLECSESKEDLRVD